MKITIPKELMDLNRFINSQRVNRYAGAKAKKEQTNLCRIYVKRAMAKGLKVDDYPLLLKFTWYMKDRRRDPDNVAFSKKFILDSMVTAGLLENDGQRQIYGFEDRFQVDKDNPRVEIEIEIIGGK